MLNEDTLALMIPILAIAIPIIYILTAHQRKMAEIIHSRAGAGGGVELEGLRQEIRELRALVSHHAIMIDDLHKNQAAAPPTADVQQRLGVS